LMSTPPIDVGFQHIIITDIIINHFFISRFYVKL